MGFFIYSRVFTEHPRASGGEESACSAGDLKGGVMRGRESVSYRQPPSPVLWAGGSQRFPRAEEVRSLVFSAYSLVCAVVLVINMPPFHSYANISVNDCHV